MSDNPSSAIPSRTSWVEEPWACGGARRRASRRAPRAAAPTATTTAPLPTPGTPGAPGAPRSTLGTPMAPLRGADMRRPGSCVDRRASPGAPEVPPKDSWTAATTAERIRLVAPGAPWGTLGAHLGTPGAPSRAWGPAALRTQRSSQSS